jgi:hypothetical protein
VLSTQSLELHFAKLEKMEIGFKHVFCILIEADDSSRFELWQQLNEKCPSGRVRLFKARDSFEAEACVLRMYFLMSQEDKANNQKAYFESQRGYSMSSEAAKGVVKEGLSRVGLPESASRLITHAAPSIGVMAEMFSTYTAQELAENIPLDAADLNAVVTFFSDRGLKY